METPEISVSIYDADDKTKCLAIFDLSFLPPYVTGQTLFLEQSFRTYLDKNHFENSEIIKDRPMTMYIIADVHHSVKQSISQHGTSRRVAKYTTSISVEVFVREHYTS